MWVLQIFPTVLYGKININWYTLLSYFLLVNKLHELNIFKLQIIFQTCLELKHYLYLRSVNVFSFMESSILNIKHVFSSFLVFRLYRFGGQIIHLNSDHVRFLGSVDIGGFL